MEESEQEAYNKYIERLQNELDNAEIDKKNMQKHLATMFSGENNDNLVKWQLDIKEELERIEHLLRQHIPKYDSEGNEYWEEPEECDKLFNEKGIKDILNNLAWYLNKAFILANFKEDDIRQRVYQFGYKFNDYIFENYEKLGLDTPEKLKHIPLIVMNVTNIVEATYYRALNGGERESLRTARMVTQNEAFGFGGANNGFPMLPPKKQFTISKPSTWFNR